MLKFLMLQGIDCRKEALNREGVSKNYPILRKSSPSALTEHESPNIAGTFLLNAVHGWVSKNPKTMWRMSCMDDPVGRLKWDPMGLRELDSPKHLERLVCLSMKTLALMMFPKGLKVCKRFVSNLFIFSCLFTF